MGNSSGAMTIQDREQQSFLSRHQKGIVIFAFMVIPMVLLFVFTYLPFFKMIQFSFYNRNYLSEGTFVGLKNYTDVFKRDDCFKTLWVSVYYMGGAVVQLALALFFATLMVFKVKGSNLYKACLFFPYLICGIAVGFIFKFFYAHGYVLDNILMAGRGGGEHPPLAPGHPHQQHRPGGHLRLALHRAEHGHVPGGHDERGLHPL